MYRRRFAFILLTAISLSFTLNGCVKSHGVSADMTVSDNSQPRKGYPSHESTEKAKVILSSATYLDNLVAGERAPAGEHVWAFNVLLRSVSPRSEFTKLFNSESHYVRCYALIGLKMTDGENYKMASQIFGNDKVKHQYSFGCQGMDIPNAEFINLLDTGRIKRKYFEIENFESYLEDREKFLKNSERFMIGTGFGL